MELDQIATTVERALLLRGINGLVRKDSQTTNSIYILVEYGLLGDIRIADHAGKHKHRFELRLDNKKKYSVEMRTYETEIDYFEVFPSNCVAALVESVVHSVHALKFELGDVEYNKRLLRIKNQPSVFNKSAFQLALA